MKLNWNIIHCFAKIVKSSVIKERTWIILCKINVKRIFVSSDCKKFGWLTPKEMNRYRLLFGIAMLYFVRYICCPLKLQRAFDPWFPENKKGF